MERAFLLLVVAAFPECFANDCCRDCSPTGFHDCKGGLCTWASISCEGPLCGGRNWCPTGPAPTPPPTPAPHPPTPAPPPPPSPRRRRNPPPRPTPAPTPPPTPAPTPPPGPHGDTQLTRTLNAAIAGSSYPVVYKNGKGVIVRNPFDGFENDQDKKVVPATLWVNDIFSPSQLYVGYGGGNGNPWCPTSTIDCPKSSDTGDSGSFNSIQMGYLIESKLGQLFNDWNNVQDDNWGNGVFYASDSNSADLRCAYFKTSTYEGYDCPGGWLDMNGQWTADSSKKGAGFYDGKGCHFNHYNNIDQTNAKDPDHQNRNLVQNYECECEYSFNADWSQWIDQWITIGENGKKGDSWQTDLAACWLNNPRDMINLQNNLYWKRKVWNNQRTPQVSYKDGDAASNRPYWGWNEIPVNRQFVSNQQNWDAVVIKLPAAACGGNGESDLLSCIPSKYQIEFEKQLDQWQQGGYLGNHDIVMVREYMDSSSNYFRKFFCQQWKGQRYTIHYDGNSCKIQQNFDTGVQV